MARNANTGSPQIAEPAPGLSVVVPLLNEIAALPNLKEGLQKISADQIILVDGGSKDGTPQWVQDHWPDACVQLVCCEAGRAVQMNAGAAQAKHAMLLFLHADTQLPTHARAEVCCATPSHQAPLKWGRFDLQFSTRSNAMRVIAWFINQRSRLSKVSTGDQAIFVHQTLFNQVGGYAAIPLMEDIALCKTLRRIQVPYNSPLRVITSARRWEENGVAATVLKMWWFRFAYFIGVSPVTLAKSYRNIRR